MKKLLVMISALAIVGSVLAQNTTTTTTTTTAKTDETTTSGVQRIVEIREGRTETVTKPETVIKKVYPRKVVAREALESFFEAGLRTSLDYHMTPKEATLSCLWAFGEIYGNYWGVELGVGKVEVPTTSYTDGFGTTFTGNGMSHNHMVDLMGKYYFWFAPRNFWLGAGLTYYGFSGGYFTFADTTVAAAASNAAAPTAAFKRYVETDENNRLYAQFGLGVRIALSGDRLYFTPDVRFLLPLVGKGNILRVDAAIAYAFPIGD